MSRKRANRKPKPKGPTLPKSARKSTHLSRVNRMIPGLQMSWFDPRPLEHKELDENSIKVTHRSPSINGFHLWASNADHIQSKSCWEWGIKIVSVFGWDKKNQEEKRYIRSNCVLEDLHDCVNDRIKETIRYGSESRYLGSYFTIECLGRAKTHLDDVNLELKRLLDQIKRNGPEHDIAS